MQVGETSLGSGCVTIFPQLSFHDTVPPTLTDMYRWQLSFNRQRRRNPLALGIKATAVPDAQRRKEINI